MALAFVGSAHAQMVNKYWVEFTDKAGTPYTLDNPSDYLGPRALERRAQQGIAVDSLDLPVSPAYIEALQAAGFTVQNRSKWLNGVVVFSQHEISRSEEMKRCSDIQTSRHSESDNLEISKSENLSDNPQNLYDFPFVRKVVFCGTDSLTRPEEGRSVIPENPEYEPYGRYYDSFYYNHSHTQIGQLNGIELHRHGFEGQGVIVGVCDGGFPGVDNISFFDSMRHDGRLLATRDFVWGGEDVYNISGHGTMVLSTMAGYLPGYYVGTAPKASYILCRTENTKSEGVIEEYNWAAAAEYLDSMGADIITSSLGYYSFDDSTMSYTNADLDGRTAPMSIAADIAAKRGMLIINAAGNEGDEIPQHLNVPADVERVLTVGAVMSDGEYAYFSSHGPTADNRVKPDVMAMGMTVPCAAPAGVLAMASGTSLATPILAGMMACLWQHSPELTPKQLCDSVRSWGNHANNVNDTVGYGIPDFSRALAHDTAYTDIVELQPHKPAFVIRPNPTRGKVRVVIKSNQVELYKSRLLLCDAYGRELGSVTITEPHQTLNMDLQSYPDGVYIVTLVTPQGRTSKKLIVDN